MGWRLGVSFAVVALLYLDPVPQSMALNILDLATSLVDHGSIDLDEYHGMDVAVRDGRILSGMPPGAALIAALVYAIFHPLFHLLPGYSVLAALYVFCTVFVGIPAGAVTVYVVYRLAIRWGASVRNALLTAGLLAFGTMHLGYATGFYQKALAAACLMGAFSLATTRHVFRAGLAGLLTGLAVGQDHQSTVIAVGIAGYFLSLRPGIKTGLAFAAGAGLTLAPLLIYNHVAFGSPWLTGYHFRPDPLVAFGPPRVGPFMFLLITLLGASPCLAWSAIGWWRAAHERERRNEMFLIVYIVVSTLVLVSAWGEMYYPHEVSLASRLLLPMLPFAVLPLAFGLPAGLNGWPLAVIGWSVGATFLATQASMIPTNVIPPVYALKVFGTSWGTGPLFSEQLASWLAIPTLHLTIAKGVARTGALLQPENRRLLVELLLGQALIKLISLTVTAVALALLWRFVWRPVAGLLVGKVRQ
jgi:hypothetical protein